MTIQVAIIDDQDVIRVGVEQLLAAAHQIHVVGGFADIASFCRAPAHLDTDVVLLDDTLPTMAVAQSVQALHRECPHTALLILGRELTANEMQRLLVLDVAGFVSKQEPLGDVLVAGIRHVVSGRVYFSPEAALIGTQNGDSFALTPRLLEVLKLIARGDHVQQMALELGISPRALYAARVRLRQAFSVRTDAQVVAEAIRRGILRDE